MGYGEYKKFGSNYEVDTSYGGKLSTGDYIVVIKDVTLERTKNGHPMAKIILDVHDTGGRITYYLVDNRSNEKNIEWSNRRLTKFFDCFSIERGNFKTNTWIGHSGEVHIDKAEEREDGKSWFEIKYLIVKKRNTVQNKDTPTDISASCKWDDVLDFEKEERGYTDSIF